MDAHCEGTPTGLNAVTLLMFHSFSCWVAFNCKLTRLSVWSPSAAFWMEAAPKCTDPAWVQFGVWSGACSRTVETDREGRLKWFDVTRRPPTWHVDLAANTGVTPLNRPKNIDLSLLLHLLSLSSSPSLFFSHLSLFIFLSLSFFSSLSQPHPHPTPPPPLSLHAVS